MANIKTIIENTTNTNYQSPKKQIARQEKYNKKEKRQ
jgi:hypothetical protein